MTNFVFALAAITVLVPSPQPEKSPERLVQSLFSNHFKHGMGFTKASVSRKAKWLSEDFLKQLRQELNHPASPDEVPNIDGDPFTDSQEYPTRFKVGKAEIKGDSARVPVVLSGNGRKRTVVAILNQTTEGWRVDDLAYEEGKTLRAELGR